MFFTKKLEVSIKELPLVNYSNSTSVSGPQPPGNDSPPKANTDLAFKLFLSAVSLTQAILMVYGYSVLVGHFDSLGIDVSEISLSTPTMLLYGYVYFLTDALSFANIFPGAGPALLLIVFIAISIMWIYFINKALKLEHMIWLGTGVALVIFLAFVAPVFGVAKGAGFAVDDYFETALAHPEKKPEKLKREHTVFTEKHGEITGRLILADAKNTFMLRDRTVYKIDSQTGKVLRTVTLRAADTEEHKN